jgi:phosphonate transport system substrate-binding protein
VIGKERYGIEAIAAIKPSYNTPYRSYIIVPATSAAKSLRDLKGKTFAFVDLRSYTGRLVPLYMIKEMGEDPLKFFSDVIFSKSHENSLILVSEGKVDGAGVISLLVEHALREDPQLKKKIKIIDKSEPAGFPVFATVRYTSNGQRERIKNVLLNMHKDPKGKAILRKLEIDYLYEPKDSEYDLIRKHYRTVKEFVP